MDREMEEKGTGAREEGTGLRVEKRTGVREKGTGLRKEWTGR